MSSFEFKDHSDEEIANDAKTLREIDDKQTELEKKYKKHKKFIFGRQSVLESMIIEELGKRRLIQLKMLYEKRS